MSKILANQIANYADNSPIELKEGLNIPAGKELQAGGTFGTLGQVLSSTGTTIQWTNPFSGNYQDLTNKPTIPAAQVQSDWNATSGIEVIKNKPSIPGVPSVTVASASGGGNLSYNGGNGEFTYTPPDLSGYLTSLGAAAGVTTQKITNWDNAFGWGDHSTEGYLTSVPALALGGLSNVSSNAPSPGQVLKWTGSEWAPGTDLTSAAGSGIALTDLSTSTGAASGGGSFSYDNTTGVFTFAPADLTGYLSAGTDTLQSVITRGGTVTSGSPSFGTNVIFTGTGTGAGNNGAPYVLWDKTNNDLLLSDDTSIILGYSGDLELKGGGTESLIRDKRATSVLKIGADSLVLQNKDGNEPYIECTDNGSVKIYHDFNPILETTLTGITVSGSITASAGNSTNWNTAYGWGDHSAGGYLTSLGDAILDGDFTSNGFMKRTGAGTYSVDTSTYLTDIVSDTTPQLGSSLDLNGFGIFGSGGGITKTSISETEGYFPGGFGVFAGAASIGWKFDSSGGAVCRADGPNSDGTSINALQIGNFSDLSCLTIDGAGTVATDSTITATGGFVGNATTAGDLSINATGRILFQASNNNTDILAAGNAGEILTTGGSGVTPSWTNTPTLGSLTAGLIKQTGPAVGGGTTDAITLGHGSNWWDFGLVLSATNSGKIPLKFMGSTVADGVTFAMPSGGMSGQVNFTIPIADGAANDVLVTDGNGALSFQAVGAGLSTRQTYTATTISIADGATDNITIVGYKAYGLIAIEPSAAAWVTVYTDATARSADSGRSENTDPLPGSGVIAEVITTSANQKQVITPGTIGWNNDGTPSTNMYLKVVNKSGSNAAITVGMTVIKLEA